MTSPEIEEFAKTLVETVRDAAIRASDLLLDPNAKGPTAKRWRQAMKNGTPAAFAKVVIPEVVDGTIFYLLHAIDEGTLKLAFADSKGKTVDLENEGLGELAGWYAGGDWPSQYSRERFHERHLPDLPSGPADK